METALKPPRLETEIGAQNASKAFTHWKKLMSNYATIIDKDDKKQYMVLINFLSNDLYNLVSDTESFTEAMKILQDNFVKPVNVIYQRHLLANRKQREDESISQYLSALHLLAKDAGYKQVTAQVNMEHGVRDSLISGMKNPIIRQKIFESKKEELNDIVDLALIYESAQMDAAAYSTTPNGFTAPIVDGQVLAAASKPIPPQNFSRKRESPELCTRCGFTLDHKGGRCPALGQTCTKCSRRGHFSRCCMSGQKRISATVHPNDENVNNNKPIPSAGDFSEESYPFVHSPFLASMGGKAPSCLEKSLIDIMVHKNPAEALVDSGSAYSYVSSAFVSKYKLRLIGT